MPIILYTLLIAVFLPVILALMGSYYRLKNNPHFEHDYPRLQQAALTGLGARLQGAEANAREALPAYASMVLIASLSGLPLQALDMVAILFIISRVLHAIFYMMNLATLRSTSFVFGLGCYVWMFYLSFRHL